MRQELLEKLMEITPEEQAILSEAQLDLKNYNRTGETVVDPGTILPSGHLFGIRMHTRFVDFPRHGHNYVEMVYQIAGSTEHIINGVTPLTLSAGQLLFLGRGCEHEIKAAGRDTAAVNFILIPMFFDSAAISLGGSNALSVFLKGNLRRTNDVSGFLVFDIRNQPMIGNLLENLVMGELENTELSIQQLTLEVLFQHLSKIPQNLVVETRADREQAVVLEMLARLEKQVRFNLSEFAEEMGIGMTTLSRMIQSYTGCTFTELQHTARFNRAAQLLRETDLSVADIALAVGYENTAFFYRHFSKRFGCTPAEYRRSQQNRI